MIRGKIAAIMLKNAIYGKFSEKVFVMLKKSRNFAALKQRKIKIFTI